MNAAFRDQGPTFIEIEKLRLILSTYQDGSGQLSGKKGLTLPGWRDFERSVALVFAGQPMENKFIFDVIIPKQTQDSYIGISCKMRRTLDDTKRTGRVTLELSNSSGAFWKKLNTQGIHQQNYKKMPLEVARVLLAQEHEWHHRESLERGGIIDLSGSFYLALSWNKQGEYQLFIFALALPDPEDIAWDFPVVKQKQEVKTGRRLRGQDRKGAIFEWYGESGGQLKYYPMVETALWKSEIFHLEPLPDDWETKHGILAKTRDYFLEK